MADVKITDLGASSGLVSTDLFVVVDNPSGTPATEKATGAQVAAMVNANARIAFGTDITTGTTATDTLAHGTMYNLDASSGTITITVNSGTAGDEMVFRVSDLSNSITLSDGTATATEYGKTSVDTVEDRIVLFWRTATAVDAYITGTA